MTNNNYISDYSILNFETAKNDQKNVILQKLHGLFLKNLKFFVFNFKEFIEEKLKKKVQAPGLRMLL